MIIIEKSFEALKSAGIDVFFAGTHKGGCLSPYAVLKKLSSSPFLAYSSDIHYFEVLCCSPHISGCYELADKVQAALERLSPAVKSTRNVSEPYFSNVINGWIVQLEYHYYKKI